MTRRATFRQGDAAKALRAAIATGLTPSGYTIEPDGSIKVEFSDAVATAPRNPLDRVLRP